MREGSDKRLTNTNGDGERDVASPAGNRITALLPSSRHEVPAQTHTPPIVATTRSKSALGILESGSAAMSEGATHAHDAHNATRQRFREILKK